MGKKVAASKIPKAPLGGGAKKTQKDSLFEKKSRNFRIGGDIQPPRDLTRFTKWPQFIRLQRQKRILLQRLKVPSTLAQFEATADKNQMASVLRLLKKYQPETKEAKAARLAALAEASASGKSVDKKCPPMIKFGINHVYDLVEQNKAKLVIIAHDVDPIELICCLPALCRKKEVPYMIVKGKSRLGQLVHKKTATCLALTEVKKEDTSDLKTLCESATASFNDNVEVRRRQGGGIQGVKSQHVTRRRQLALEKELAKKTGLIVK
jgi:large subunit ribosomal protein L7Ae